MEPTDKPWWQSRMVWVAVLTIVVSIIGVLQAEELIAQYPTVVAILGIVLGVANVILRFITTKAISVTRFTG